MEDVGADGVLALAFGTFTSPAPAQQADFDLADFECWKIRRDGHRWELDRLTSDGPVPTAFTCEGRSCVNRELIQAEDGTVTEVFRHIYFPRGRPFWAPAQDGQH